MSQTLNDLRSRLLSVDQILRRSLVLDPKQPPFSRPEVNEENTTTLQLRGVLKLLFSKVPLLCVALSL